MSDITKAKQFLAEARGLIANGANEAVVRKKLEQYLPQIFPTQPWWVKLHAEGAENHIKFEKGGVLRHGFVDTLIGATAIEYEPNLQKLGVDEHAQDQVRDYIAGLVNKGVPIETIVGITSDTIRWNAFRPDFEPGKEAKQPLGGSDIALHPIENIDLSASTSSDGPELIRFLERHVGRPSSRPLEGRTIAADLGLESISGVQARAALDGIEQAARAKRPAYGDLIDRLWSELIDTIGQGGASRSLGLAEYLDEFYLITLAKLICANVLDRKAVNRPDLELAGILDGSFFSGRGLQNYVEYDLFGWLSEDAAASGMLDVARDIQANLTAYDFSSLAIDDLFGELLASLGRKSTRLILGQELTPAWLARQMVGRVAELLDGTPLRMVDTACGSGTMLVEAIRHENSITVCSQGPTETARRIAASATGFDIDPVAALFAKTNWVIAMRDHLQHLDEVAIPVFHADSLFAGVTQVSADDFVLKLDDSSVTPPAALLDDNGRVVFDHILSTAYPLAMTEAKGTGDPDTRLAATIAGAAINLADDATAFDVHEVTDFVASLIRELALLQRGGRNGLWNYVIRNTSRAAQSSAQFNAMVINPPWLALSKIGGNPYAKLLSRLGDLLGVKPEAQSSLHTELSTVFLLEGVRRYLEPGGIFACVLPSTVAEGHHQNKFRSGAYATAQRAVEMDASEIWKIGPGVFKNEAIVLFGAKSAHQARTTLIGHAIDEGGRTSLPYIAVSANYPSGNTRIIWTPKATAKNAQGFGFNPADFRQGADLMPRTAWFHDFQAYGNGRSKAFPIRSGSSLWYLLRDADAHKGFRLKSGIVIDKQFLVNAVMSNQLSPFSVASPDRMLIPAVFTGAAWRGLSMADTVTSGQGTRDAFDAIAALLNKSVPDLFPKVDFKQKLRNQVWSTTDYLVLSGAGGAIPCAAWVDPGTYASGEVVFDQTIYWAAVASEAEAAYLTGAINSPACAEIIRPFQPRGAKGPRHVHKLPFAITPKYDPADQDHVELADATLDLVHVWRALLASDPTALAKTQPMHSTLQHRRIWVTKALRGFPEWTRYEQAADQLYGSP